VTDSRHRFRAAFSLVGAVARRAFRHGSTGQASQFAYNAFIATVPFLFVVVASISKAAGRDAYERTSAEFDRVVPEELRGLLLKSLQIAERNAGSATLLLVLAVPVALYVIGNAMSSLVDGIDDALGVPRRNWVRSKLVSIVLAAAASVFVLATTAALIGGAGLVSRVVGLFGGSYRTHRDLSDLDRFAHHLHADSLSTCTQPSGTSPPREPPWCHCGRCVLARSDPALRPLHRAL
jgi:uncharacterized BrkB/YihY/UPF0761 family membrane protein